MTDHPVLKIAGRRVIKGSFQAEDSTFRRLVADCPHCSSTDTKPLSYNANTFPYSVYECRACAHVWRFLQADAEHPSDTITLREAAPARSMSRYGPRSAAIRQSVEATRFRRGRFSR